MGSMWSAEGEFLSSLGPNGELPEQPAKKKRKKKADKPVEGHTALSSSQAEAIKAAEAARFPEPDEGILCSEPGCGTRITGSMADLDAHRKTHE